jgi:RHS repeat-associated protein
MSITNETANTTTYTRDTNNRVTRIDYPDGGFETFTYNSFGEILTHQLRTGGTETFTYDARGLKLEYRDPAHATGNATARYAYDALDRVSDTTDAFGSNLGDPAHTTSHTYNQLGQILTTTKPIDPVDGQRHTVTNSYNADGTLASTTDELGHTASYTYDDYKRTRSVTTPQRFAGDTTPRTTYTYYDATGAGDDYSHTEANPTFIVLPGGEMTNTTYDENRRKLSVTVGYGTSAAATTSYEYDDVGNLTGALLPKQQSGQPYAGQKTITQYDERNRAYSVTDPLGRTTTTMFDAAGRKKSVTRPNGQATTFDSYDTMNRLLQQTLKQTPSPDAVTKFTYDPASGLLATMQDPRLVATGSPQTYSYTYDNMGRKTQAMFPAAAPNPPTTEIWHYDTLGRVDTFTNRAGTAQATTYDALSRVTSVTWSDAVTPSVTYTYDVGSRKTSIVNANATIGYSYLNDNLLSTETTTYADNVPRTITYTYNADASRASIQYPNGLRVNSTYTPRNQLDSLINNAGGATIASHVYDLNGNLTARNVTENSTSSSYTYDGLDRSTHIAHAFAGGNTRTFDYGYYSDTNNRKWTKRDSNKGDVFGYDLNDEVTATQLDVVNPDTSSPVAASGIQITYDANGNRNTMTTNSVTDTYVTNDLNQYNARTSSPTSPGLYDPKGNATTNLDGTINTYDAQNRVLTVQKGTVTETYKYDGINRQVSRAIASGLSSATNYNVYDGWNLIAEYASGSTTPTNSYVYGPSGLVKRTAGSTSTYFYQDASGSTSHLANSGGNLLEWCRYDLQGTPLFYDSTSQPLTASTVGNRFLFTGQQWYSDVSVYDLRNRFYSPDTGRFLQADPIGFKGDATNLYRYCGNNPIMRSDPEGTEVKPPIGPIEHVILFNNAISRLNQSPTFRTMYKELTDSKNTYQVKTVGVTKDYFNGHDTIGWGPELNLQTTRGTFLSAAIMLAHELKHAHHYDYDRDGYKIDARNTNVPHGWDNQEEINAVKFEQRVAREIGEGKAIRDNHRGPYTTRYQRSANDAKKVKDGVMTATGGDNKGSAPRDWGPNGNMTLGEYNWSISESKGPMAYSPVNAAEATNYSSPTASVGQVFMTDFAFGSWDPDSPYPAGPVNSAMYGNHSW